KKINDNFGHHVGDEVLILVSDLLKETMRSRDLLSRFGGEEFVALLPFADSNKAKAIAMRINDKIAQYDFSSLVLQTKVTFSIGVATMTDNQMSFDDLLHNADLAMYQAKEQGRNTVVCYQNISEAPS
ncbi:MAG TPA: GGDEF domain-containing protein, partial [Colwellia sp.]|nr:GGDEF domain-containing protein [Colwellia sp.]